MTDEALVYQRIGEITVSFQSLENKLREIGWYVLDPDRRHWPPKDLRSLTNEILVDRVHKLFLEALPRCKLDPELEATLRSSFALCAKELHQLRRDRNRILHSAYVGLKAGGEVVGLMRSNPKLNVDEETGEVLYDQELLTPESFTAEMRKMSEVAVFLGRAYLQLIHRYPHGGALPSVPPHLER